MRHVPVLLREVIEYLKPQPNENFIDATVGDGGHALEILKRTAPQGKLLGIDWDSQAIEGMRIARLRPPAFGNANAPTRIKDLKIEGMRIARLRPLAFGNANAPTRIKDLKIEISASKLDAGLETRATEPHRSRSGIGPRHITERLVLAEGNFKNIKEIAVRLNFKNIKGILFDLGLASSQIEQSGRGFSYLRDEPLKMTFSKRTWPDAAAVLNTWPQNKLERIFKEFGQERHWRRISRAIAAYRQGRQITTSGQLAEIIRQAAPSGGIKTLARTFQALRMAVNGELANLRQGLDGAWQILAGGGRLAVISFHSLEDRPVKNFFREKEKEGGAKILTPRPIVPSPDEIKLNPRARSAKLRAITKNF